MLETELDKENTSFILLPGMANEITGLHCTVRHLHYLVMQKRALEKFPPDFNFFLSHH